MRTFLALNLPDNIRDSVADVILILSKSHQTGINWVIKENLHITFQFIGDTQRHHIKDITDECSNIFSDVAPILFDKPKLEIIPANQPRIVWISLQTEDKKIFSASRRLKDFLSSLQYDLDRKPLRFHITLGRVKKRLPDFFIQKILTTELNIFDFVVSKATLYESFLRPQGPIYESIAEIDF